MSKKLGGCHSEALKTALIEEHFPRIASLPAVRLKPVLNYFFRKLQQSVWPLLTKNFELNNYVNYGRSSERQDFPITQCKSTRDLSREMPTFLLVQGGPSLGPQWVRKLTFLQVAHEVYIAKKRSPKFSDWSVTIKIVLEMERVGSKFAKVCKPSFWGTSTAIGIVPTRLGVS